MVLSSSTSQAGSRLIPRIDAGDILAGEIEGVKSVIASIQECRERPPAAIFSEPMSSGSSEEKIRDECESEVIVDSNDAAHLSAPVEHVVEDGDAEGVVVNNSNGSCWTRRVGRCKRTVARRGLAA